MSDWVFVLYFPIFAFWLWAIYRERGIGVGVRFILGLFFFAQILLGPFLAYLVGLSQDPDQAPYVDKAMVMSLGALAAFIFAGYVLVPKLASGGRLRFPEAWKPFTDPEALRVQLKVALLLLLVGFAAHATFSYVHGIPTVTAVWSVLKWLSFTGAGLLALNGVLRVGVGSGFVAVASVTGVGLFLAVSTGFVGQLLIVSFYIAIILALSKRVSLARWIVIGLVGFAGLIPYNMWLEGRSSLREEITERAPIQERVSAFFETTNLPSANTLTSERQVELIRKRMDLSRFLIAAVEYTPNVEPYANGETMADGFVALVPRALWRDKPIMLGGSEFVSKFTGLRFAQGTSIGLHPIFEFYVNFGYVGAVTGIGIIGMVAGLLDYLFMRRGAYSLTVQVVVIQSLWIIMWSDQIIGLAMSGGAMVAVVLGARWIINRFRRTSESRLASTVGSRI